MPTGLEKAYAAGFFDGDGALSVSMDPHTRQMRVNVAITQKDPVPLHWLAARWGGEVKPERDRYWRWRPPNREQFIRDIEPYLVMKKERVQRLITDYFNRRRSGNFRTSQEDLDLRTALCQYFRDTNYASAGKPSRIGGDAQ